MMETVYVLHHVRAIDESGEEVKLIGIYRSKEATDAATARLSGQPGFRDYPDGFQAEPYELDKDHWTEGFVTVPSLRGSSN
jgi:homoserine kinase type II